MTSFLDNWYIKGKVLHPNPEYLRDHVTALSNAQDEATHDFHFPADNRTVSFGHAQLSNSPLRYLGIFARIEVEGSSQVFDTVRRFVYCTPVDLSDLSERLVQVAWGWHLEELYTACFQVAETSQLDTIHMIQRYTPLGFIGDVPTRFIRYFAGRVAIDAQQVSKWLDECTNRASFCTCLRARFCLFLGGIRVKEHIRNALRRHASVNETDIVRNRESSILAKKSKVKREEHRLLWRVPLGNVLMSGQEYIETEMSMDGVTACMEVTWNYDGAGLVVGVQQVDESGFIDIHAGVIGLPCVCAHQKHNEGWELDGAVERRSQEWVVSHEVSFVMFDAAELKEWRRIHTECGLLVKVRVTVADSDADTEATMSEDGDTDSSDVSDSSSDRIEFTEVNSYTTETANGEENANMEEIVDREENED